MSIKENTLRFPPGSNEPLEKGCKCPRIDNCRGRGYMNQPGLYVCNTECTLHAEGEPERE